MLARQKPELGGRRKNKIENDEFLFGLVRDFTGGIEINHSWKSQRTL